MYKLKMTKTLTVASRVSISFSFESSRAQTFECPVKIYTFGVFSASFRIRTFINIQAFAVGS
jgi:hypothetical protein